MSYTDENPMLSSFSKLRDCLLVLLVAALAVPSLASFSKVENRNSASRLVLNQQFITKTEDQQAPASGGDSDATAFASLVKREVSQLQEGVTLAKWMNGRGKVEKWESTAPDWLTGGPDKECLSLRRTDTLPSGAKVMRALYFYPPSAPSLLSFPAASRPVLLASCKLAWIWLEVESSTPEFGRAMARIASAQLTQVYGNSAGEKTISLWRPGLSGDDVSHWAPHADIVLDYDEKPGLDLDAPGQLLKGPVVRLIAQLPKIHESDSPGWTARQASTFERVQFRRAIVAAGVDAGLSQRMEKLYELDTALSENLEKQVEQICKIRCEPEDLPRPKGDEWRTPLLPLLRDWFKATGTAEEGRRAAGLLAAHSLLAAFDSVRPWNQFGNIESSTPEQTQLRSALEALGATFQPGFEDPTYRYSGNWLDRAKDSDLDTEGGRLALATWMSAGDGCPQSGSQTFRTVISKGEALLTKKEEDRCSHCGRGALHGRRRILRHDCNSWRSRPKRRLQVR